MVRTTVVAALLLAAASAACGPPPHAGDAPAPAEEELRIVTARDRAARDTLVYVRLPGDGYTALFELQAGRGIQMVFPRQDALTYDGSTIVGVRHDATKLAAGLHRIRRPRQPWAVRRWGTVGSSAYFTADDRVFAPYECVAPPEDFPVRSFDGGGLLLVWSPEPLRITELWTAPTRACAQRDVYALADSVAARLTRGHEATWHADLTVF